eukprot:3482469-Ditylum_brightwellii.AAC.2
MEYYALVDIKTLSHGDNNEATEVDSVISGNQKHGRPRRRVFRFHLDHPLYHSHGQYLKAKQPTLIHNAYVPKLPGEPPQKPHADASCFELDTYDLELQSWTEAANAFTQFYSIVFLPHVTVYGDKFDTEENTALCITWQSFCATIKTMEESDILIDRVRLRAMDTFINALPSNYKNQTLLNNFWHRKTTIWSELERHEAAK